MRFQDTSYRLCGAGSFPACMVKSPTSLGRNRYSQPAGSREWRTVSTIRRQLVVVRTLTTLSRLLDVLSLTAGDRRIQTFFTHDVQRRSALAAATAPGAPPRRASNTPACRIANGIRSQSSSNSPAAAGSAANPPGYLRSRPATSGRSHPRRVRRRSRAPRQRPAAVGSRRGRRTPMAGEAPDAPPSRPPRQLCGDLRREGGITLTGPHDRPTQRLRIGWRRTQSTQQRPHHPTRAGDHHATGPDRDGLGRLPRHELPAQPDTTPSYPSCRADPTQAL